MSFALGLEFIVDKLPDGKEVTNVEPFLLLQRYGDAKSDKEVDGVQAEGDKTIANLLMEQIEFANVVIINKADLVSETQVSSLRTIGLF